MLFEKLDDLWVLKYRVVDAEALYSSIIDSIINKLSDLCVFKEKRVRRGEITLVFSCNNDKACVYIVLDPIPVNEFLDKLDLYYYVQGGRCE